MIEGQTGREVRGRGVSEKHEGLGVLREEGSCRVPGGGRPVEQNFL